MDGNGRQRRMEQLRQEALARLDAAHGHFAGVPTDKIEELFHELEVHQVELEVQNEELRRTELALADALARYQDLYDRAPVGYLTMDARATIMQANQAAVQICGRERGDLYGATLSSLIVPEDRHKVDMLVAEAAARGVPLSGEFRIARRSRPSRVVHAEISRLARKETSGFRLMWIDITARVAADAELRESERRFRLASDASATLVYERDVRGAGLMQVHGLERVTGHDGGARDLNGAWWTSLVHPDDRSIYGNHLETLATTGEPHVAVYRIRRADGAWITVEDRAQLMDTGRGNTPALAGTIVDITERRLAEDRLRDADRRKDEFLATLAHELRNPLAPVRNAVEILRSQSLSPEELTWARDVIDRQIDHMSRLVDDLLDVSRITRGKVELRKARVSLQSVMEETVEACRPLMDTAGHTLLVDVPREPIFLDADATRLSQALQNLLNNAAKYTPHGGTIWFRASAEGHQAVISVRDTGIGMPSDMLPTVFDMFMQGESSIERRQGGIGIGLTLVRRLIELHGGQVEAHSDGEGQGSEFIVRIPCLESEPSREHEPAPRRAAASARAGASRILVVDDNRDSADTMAMYLRGEGHDVRTAHDGHSALDIAAEFDPAVILLDIGLPEMNGYDVARELRRRNGSHVGLIAMTGWGQDDDRRRAREAGFDHHLTKPVDFALLTSALDDASRRKEKEGA